MTFGLDNSPNLSMDRPRKVVRWQYSNPGLRRQPRIESVAMPEILIAEKARWALENSDAWLGPQLDTHLTDGEIAYVLNYWDQMPGNTCFHDAVVRIAKGIPPKHPLKPFTEQDEQRLAVALAQCP